MKNLIEQKLQECDAEIQWKYDYIDKQCCEIEDQELELAKEIAELEVEKECAIRLKDNEDAKEIEREIKEDKEYLEYLYAKEDVMEDLWDEMTAKLLEE